MKDYSFKNSKGFRGFKRVNIVCHRIVELPQTEPDMSDAIIELKATPCNMGDMSYKVFVHGNHIGSIFGEVADMVTNDKVTGIHIHFDQTEEGFRPRMFLQIKE